MTNTKFKSGDKVVFRKSSLESGMIDAKEGDLFTVQECHGPGCRVISLKELPGYYHKTHFEHYIEKEKVMEKYIPEVGDKVKGFVFDGDDYLGIGYPESMDDVVGEHGTVCRVSEDRFVIDFGDNCWTYPLELANLAKIEESSQETSNENGQIHWQVGQEVWDCAYGKGIVESVSLIDDEIHVQFERFNTSFSYDVNGIIYGGGSRTLFFSEPKIIAETKPPKKPFVPVLKEGVDVFIKTKSGVFGEGVVRTVYKETEDRICTSEDGHYFLKRDIESIRVLSEQVKFS